MIVILVTPVDETDKPEVVGPFPNGTWAQRWIDRVGHKYFRCEIKLVLSGRLLNPGDKENPVIFDPQTGIDIPKS